MTIYQKGWYDQLKPALDSIGDSAVRIMNPNYDMQQMLKKLMASDPTIGQKLANMGPDAVEKLYGKQMRKYAEAMPQDLNTKIMNSLNSPETWKKITSDPNWGTKVQGFLKKEYGILTDTDIKTDTAQANTAVSQSVISGANAAVAPQIAAGNAAQADTAVSENDQRKKDEEIWKRLSPIIGKKGIYKMIQNKVFNADEVAVLFRKPEAVKQYQAEASEKWQREELNLSNQKLALDRAREKRQLNENDFKTQQNKMEELRKYMQAGKIADLSLGKADVEAIKITINTPGMTDSMLKLDKPPEDAQGIRFYNAAKAIKSAQSNESTDKVADARKQFRIREEKNFNILTGKYTPSEKQAAVARINAVAPKYFKDLDVAPSDIPQYRFDDKNPDIEGGMFGGKDDTFYEVTGSPTGSSGVSGGNVEEIRKKTPAQIKAMLNATPLNQREATKQWLRDNRIFFE